MKLKIFVLIFTLLLASCGKKVFNYIPSDDGLNKAQAVSIIEQVLFEQQEYFRPESVFISNEFLGLANGTTSNSKTRGAVGKIGNVFLGLGKTKTLTKNINKRLYFNSMGTPILILKRNKYRITLTNSEGRGTHYIYSLSEEKSKKFIDSIMYFVNRSKKFGQ